MHRFVKLGQRGNHKWIGRIAFITKVRRLSAFSLSRMILPVLQTIPYEFAA